MDFSRDICSCKEYFNSIIDFIIADCLEIIARLYDTQEYRSASASKHF